MASSENLLWMQNPQLANAMRRRQEGAALMRQGTDASPIQSPWQGVSRLAQALLGGYEARKGDEAISEAGEKRAKALADIMGGGTTPPPAAVGAALSGVAQPVQAQPLPAAGTGVDDEDLLVRTVYGEARGESPEGQRAVASVVRNRAAASGKPLRDVVFAPNQFEPWNNPQTRAQLEALDPNSPEYQTILANLRTGQGDPTGGATHFYSPTAQTALGRQPPAWAQGDGKDIGRHRFYNLPYGGGGGAQGMATPVAAPGGGMGAQPPQQPGGPGTAAFHQNRAQRLLAAGFQEEARMEMDRAKMAQQVELQRQPQPKNPIQIIDPSDPTGRRRIWIDPERATGMQAPGAEPMVNVAVNPNPPTDHRAVYDDNGRLTHYEVIPGSATDRKIAAENAAAGAKREGEIRTSNIVLEDIDRITRLMDTSILPTTGMGAGFVGKIPGTGSSDINKLLDGIKANIGFDQLNQMRAQSPTGGALGNVTERELAFLQSVRGSLDQSQSPEQFRHTLKRLREGFAEVIHGPRWREVVGGGGETTPAAGPGGGGAGGEMPTISDPAEAARLPPGTQFRTPDGRTLRVPNR
jgi:spore germination cell wall hydrolase CwlJ-like protein